MLLVRKTQKTVRKKINKNANFYCYDKSVEVELNVIQNLTFQN